MLLRPFRPEDLRTLCDIDQACFPPGVSYSSSELAAFIAHRRSKTWVVTEGNEIIGFLVAQQQPCRIGHIITIDVVKGWRRCGVGSQLMDAAERWAHQQGLLLIYLETAEDNLAAQRFYERRGYKRLEKIDGYYSNGKAAWVMAKWLSSPI